MERYTPEQIAKYAEDLDGRANRSAINKMFLEQDESHLFPIRGRFNVTRRAIKKAQWFIRETGRSDQGLEYAYLLNFIISEIVNGRKNW